MGAIYIATHIFTVNSVFQKTKKFNSCPECWNPTKLPRSASFGHSVHLYSEN